MELVCERTIHPFVTTTGIPPLLAQGTGAFGRSDVTDYSADLDVASSLSLNGYTDVA